MAEEYQQARMHRLINQLLHEKLVPELLEQSTRIVREKVGHLDHMIRFEFHEPDIISFSNLLLENDLAGANEAIEHYLSHGCTATHLILGLLDNSARHLGEMWCTDECSFADVTVGLATLHQLLRELDGRLAQEISHQPHNGSILLTTIPKDTHIFGLTVLDRFFVANDWHSEALIDPTQGQILQSVSNKPFDVVGVSLSCTHDVDECKALIRLIRECSKNTNIKIMVGGNLITERPELIDAVDADVSANTALEALHVATNIYDQQNRQIRDTSNV